MWNIYLNFTLCSSLFLSDVFPIDVLTFGKSLGNGIFSLFPIGFPIFIHIWFIGSWKKVTKKIQEDERNLLACMSIYMNVSYWNSNSIPVLITVFWRHFMTDPCHSDWRRRANHSDEAVPTSSDWRSYVKSGSLAIISVDKTKLRATSSDWRSLIRRFISISRTKLSLSPWLSYFSGCGQRKIQT